MSKEKPEEVVIVDARFFEYGQPAPESRFSGAISETSLIGYSKYTNAESREQYDQEVGMRDDGYLGYTNKNEEGMTFSSLGFINDEKRSELKSQITQSFNKDGKLAWELIVSLPSHEYAHESGFDINEDYSSLAYKIMPKVFKTMGLNPSNMIWWGDHHGDTAHPHMHLVFMENKQSRFNGKIRPKELNKIKVLFNEEIVVRREFEREMQENFKSFMQHKDYDFHNIVKVFKEMDLPEHPKIKDLKKILPKTGRLQYNAKNMLPYKKMLNSIITDMLNSKEVKPLYDEYMTKLDLLEKRMNSTARSNISSIKKTELKKLYTQIGNAILDSHKNGKINDDDLSTSNSNTGSHEDNPKITIDDLNNLDDIIDYIEQKVESTPLNKNTEFITTGSKSIHVDVNTYKPLTKEEGKKKIYNDVGNTILNNYDKKVKTGYTRNGQQIREPYSEKHLRRDCKRLIADAIIQQLMDIRQWEYENGILFDLLQSGDSYSSDN